MNTPEPTQLPMQPAEVLMPNPMFPMQPAEAYAPTCAVPGCKEHPEQWQPRAPIHGPWPEWASPLVANVSKLRWEECVADESTRVWREVFIDLLVLVSGSVEEDGKRWLHVSCSFRNRIPMWDHLCLVKDTFIGKDRKAIVVLPRAEEHINVHPNCLHLWHCLDGEGLPNFLAGRIPGCL